MRKQNKAAPAAGTAGAAAQGPRDQSETERIPILTHGELKSNTLGSLVLSYLQHGRDHAIVGRDLRQLCGMKDRELRLTLEHIRRCGAVVIGDNAGYYIPATLGEVLGYIRQEEHRNGNHWKTLESARRLAEKMREGAQVHDL